MAKPQTSTGRAADDTPVMRQHRAAKEKYPGALLFFRMGDFYELFYEDAEIAAKALDLQLTARNKNAAEEIPMAGVPYHAASAYVQRLLEQGFQVAICEQMADPKSIKGLVPREVVRVVSPGLAFDDNGLSPDQNHWVVALGFSPPAFAALDFSTGELWCSKLESEEQLWAELTRFEPKEIVLEPEVTQEQVTAITSLRPKVTRRIARAGFRDELPTLHEVIPESEAQRVQPDAAARAAAGALVAVLRESEPTLERLPLRLLSLGDGARLLVDDKAQRHLELCQSLSGERDTSLLAQLDHTATAAGARLLRRRLLAPLCDTAPIRRRHDQVESLLLAPQERERLRAALAEVGDLERIAVKLATGRAQPKDLGLLRRSLLALPEVVRAVRAATTQLHDTADREIPDDDCADLAALLARALVERPPPKLGEAPLFSPGYDATLDEVRELLTNGEATLLDLEGQLRAESEIANLKLGYTRVFGHYLEVTRKNLGLVPKRWHRKQTVANGERYTVEELDELSERLAMAESDFAERERTLFGELCQQLATHTERLHQTMHMIAVWDVAACLAEVAHRYDYVRPQVDDSLTLRIEEGRHPVVERMLPAGRFVANDCALDAGEAARFWLITGPNMAGKSTFMRQIALIVLLAQAGSFVPAKSAHIGLCDRILTRVGASDDLARGESTFMVEMKETAHVLRAASRRSLVVLDEIGRGTSTFDGLAIAWSVAEHLHDHAHCRALFATHYHELTELTRSHPGIENYSVSAKEHQGALVFFHALERGAASESYGIACAKLAGVPDSVIARATTLLGTLELKGDKRRRSRQAAPQLGLFESAITSARSDAPAPPPPVELDELRLKLRAVDVNQLTPLAALQLLAELQQAASS